MTYIPRMVDGLLDDLLAGLPAVLVVGPRACGRGDCAGIAVVPAALLGV